MKKFMILIWLILLIANFPMAQQAQLSGHNIMVLVDDRYTGDDQKSTLRMTLINKRGHERVREMTSYLKNYGKDSKSIMFFDKPADVKGTGFLSWEYDNPDKDDDRWLYLPALKKVRRISGSSKNDYFMGSDFTYDDMGGRSVNEDNHILLDEEEIDGIICWVVESTPIDKDYMYSKVIRWIHKNTHIALKVEYYDKNGNLMKILTTSDIRKQNEIWTAFRMFMDNKQEKHQTVLEFTDIIYNTGLKDNLFKVSTLERGML